MIPVELKEWKAATIELVPDTEGLYAIFFDEKLAYIGTSIALLRRLKYHHIDGVLKKRKSYKILYMELAQPERYSLEQKLINDLHPFLQTGTGGRFELEKKTCNCGDVFEPKTYWQLFCSAKCKNRTNKRNSRKRGNK